MRLALIALSLAIASTVVRPQTSPDPGTPEIQINCGTLKGTGQARLVLHGYVLLGPFQFTCASAPA